MQQHLCLRQVVKLLADLVCNLGCCGHSDYEADETNGKGSGVARSDGTLKSPIDFLSARAADGYAPNASFIVRLLAFAHFVPVEFDHLERAARTAFRTA